MFSWVVELIADYKKDLNERKINLDDDYIKFIRYGLDYVQMAIQHLIGFGKKEEFKEILAILRKQNPDRIRVL